MKKIKLLASAIAAAALIPAATLAATVVVNPANTQGWSTSESTAGGSVNFVNDPTSPAPSGALELKTNASTSAKASYLHAANTPLADVNELSYYTKQVAGPAGIADPSYQVLINANGTSGFTTLVFEPYQGSITPIVTNAWQQWDVDQGRFWSTRSVTCSGGSLVGSPGGPAVYTLAQVKTLCPNAVVIGYGASIGSNNPNYIVRTDLFNFNGTVYNFEAAPSSKQDCKDGGYAKFSDPSFSNQGQCVRYVEQHQNNGNSNNNRNNVTVKNNNSQTATSGNARSNNNTNGGNAQSGNASNTNSNTNNITITSTY